jgi:hypothetical protein
LRRMAARDPVYACGGLGGKENAKHEAELLLVLQMPFQGEDFMVAAGLSFQAALAAGFSGPSLRWSSI